VFVDGCFWHACPDHGSQPKNNDWYWSPKLAKNVERDRAADEEAKAKAEKAAAERERGRAERDHASQGSTIVARG